MGAACCRVTTAKSQLEITTDLVAAAKEHDLAKGKPTCTIESKLQGSHSTIIDESLICRGPNQSMSSRSGATSTVSQPDDILSQNNSKKFEKGFSAKIKTFNIEQDLLNDCKERLKIDVHWEEFIKLKQRNVKLDYQIIQELGRGAFGTVSKVFLKESQLLRALKSIKKTSLIKENQQKIFYEMVILKQMDHPNIIKLYEVYDWKNCYYLILELCEGGELFDQIRQLKSFTQRHAASIMKEILSPVVYMHKLNIVHRDLKPENMLFVSKESKSHLKLIDFGTARTIPQSGVLTKKVGTAYYIAPQVLAKSYNQKCDVWSCGVILYILLCGYPPFRGVSEKQILQSVKTAELKFDHKIWDGISQTAKDLIRQMLQRDPQKRISAYEAYNSPWISNQGSAKQLSQLTLENLRNFHFRNRIKAVVLTYIASQLTSYQDKIELQEIFKKLDADGDGVIERDELVSAFQAHYRNHDNLDYNNILKIIDMNNSGKIDFTEFIVAATNEEKLLNMKKLENAFAYFDIDHSGYISMDEIKMFLNEKQDTNESVRKLFDKVDLNKDGKISKEEFIQLLLKD